MPLPEIDNLNQWNIFMQEHELILDVRDRLPRFVYEIDIGDLVTKLRAFSATTRRREHEYLTKLFIMRVATEVRRNIHSVKFEDIDNIIMETTTLIHADAVDPNRDLVSLAPFFYHFGLIVRRRTIELLRKQKIPNKEKLHIANQEHQRLRRDYTDAAELQLSLKQALRTLKPDHRAILEKYVLALGDKKAAVITLRSVNRIINEIEDHFSDYLGKQVPSFHPIEEPADTSLSITDIIEMCLLAFYMDVDGRPDPTDVTRWCDAVPSLSDEIRAHAEELLKLPAALPEPGLEPALAKALDESFVRAGYWRRLPSSRAIPKALRPAI